MARLLLGVSGGIAAYKALETARLAIKAGHAVRVIQTEASTRFVGAASFEGITGAPVLVDEFEPDPLRGAYPGEPAAGAERRSAIWRWSQRADAYLIAPGERQHDRQARPRPRRQPGDHGGARRRLPGAGGAGDEQPHVPRTRRRRPTSSCSRARGVTLIAPGEGELASHGEHGIGRLAEPARAAGRGASPRWPDRLGSLARHRACWSPPAAPASRSTASASSATAPRAGWGSRSPQQAARRGAEVTLVAANVALGAAAGRQGRDGRRPRPSSADACEREFDRRDVLLMAAAVADFRPATPADHKLKKDRGPPPLELEPTAGHAQRRWPAPAPPGQVLVGFAAEHGEQAVAYGREQARAQAAGRGRGQRHLAAGDRL